MVVYPGVNNSNSVLNNQDPGVNNPNPIANSRTPYQDPDVNNPNPVANSRTPYQDPGINNPNPVANPLMNPNPLANPNPNPIAANRINNYNTLASNVNNVNSITFNPIIIVILILLIYFALFSSLGNSEDDGTNKTKNIIITVIVVILGGLIFINLIQYLLGINITAYFKNFFNPKEKHKEIDIVINKNQNKPSVPEISFKKQVFNIPGNYYDYDNAKAVCQAYGAELATYKQVEDSYESGGEWCNYGWSADQMALFPTQESTFNTLQTIEGHEHDCGRPGVNGGYIANPNVRFGVNCYGNKPKITSEEEDLMKTSTPYPQSAEDATFQKRVDFWKDNINNILISPFNYNTWG